MNNLTSIYKGSKFYKIKNSLGEKLRGAREGSFFFQRLPLLNRQLAQTLQAYLPGSLLYRGGAFLYGKLQAGLQRLFCPTVEKSAFIRSMEGLGEAFRVRPFTIFFLLLFSGTLGEFALSLVKEAPSLYGILGRLFLLGISALGLYKSYCK